jgi:hypothetical protein
MLTDAQVERYSRQILLPEVGGRGQERLLAARVVLAGAGTAAEAAATLLARAGVGALDLIDELDAPASSPECRVGRHAGRADADVVVDLGGAAAVAAALGAPAGLAGRAVVVGRQRGAAVVVAVLVGRPCIACIPPAALEPGNGTADTPALARPTALALGALAASEALLALLVPPAHGRRHLLDLEHGRVEGAPLVAAGACARCGGTA